MNASNKGLYKSNCYICFTITFKPSGHGLRPMTGGDVPEVPDVISLIHGLEKWVTHFVSHLPDEGSYIKGSSCFGLPSDHHPAEAVFVDFLKGEVRSQGGRAGRRPPRGYPPLNGTIVGAGAGGPGVAHAVST